MRARGHGTLMLFLIVSLGMLLPSTVIPEAAADITIVDVAAEGIVIPSNSGTMMPSANVSIKAVVTGSFTYDIVSNCTFHVLSNSTMNCSVAFAYPLKATSMGQESQYDSSLIVHVDGSLTNHVVLNWTSIRTDFHTNSSDTWELEHCSYAVFNLTLHAYEICTIAVDQALHLASEYYSFSFNYAIGTGKYWAGNTSETVRMEVEDRAGLLGLTFDPQPNSTETLSESTTVAVWSCSVDYFDSFWVGFIAKQHNYQGHYPPFPLWDWAALAAIVVIPCIAAAFLVFRGRSAFS